MDTKASDFRRALILGGFVDETRANDEVSLMIYDGLGKFIDEGDIVLAVGVELDGDVVTHFVSILVASLDGAADAEIRDEVDMIIIVFV